jgi:hypothetical protein
MQLAIHVAPRKLGSGVRRNRFAIAADSFRRDYTCQPCAAGECLLCDGGDCKCVCSEDLDRMRTPARRGSSEARA